SPLPTPRQAGNPEPNPKVKSQDVTPRNLASGADDAFIWQHGLMTDLGTLGGSSSLAVAINERAHVVGVSETSSGQSHAFLWQNAVMTDLGTLGGTNSIAVAINERGQVIGNSEKCYRQAVWQD